MQIGLVGIGVFIVSLAYAAKVKNNNLILVAILFLTIFMFIVTPIRKVTVDGRQVRIENKFGNYATLQMSQHIKGQVYMLFGPLEKPWGMSGYSTTVPAIAMGDIESISKQYGDYRNCGAPGSRAAFESLVELRLVGVNNSILGEINDAFSKALKTKENVFIKIDGEELSLIENKIHGRMRDRDPSSRPPIKNILIENLEFFTNKEEKK